MENFSDEQLIQQTRAGDTVALDILLRRLKPLVKASAKKCISVLLFCLSYL